MFSIEKRAFLPSFFICVGLLFALAVAGSHDYLGLCLGVFSLLIAWILSQQSTYRWTFIDVSIYTFVILLSLNLFVFNVAVSPLAYFVVTYLLSGFLIFSAINKNQLIKLYQIVVACFCVLSVWAFIQFIFGIGQMSHFSHRASVIFANPNTYAATINLLLLPLMTIYLFNESSKPRYLYTANIILFACLIMTQSRGGWIAFAMACISLFIFMKVVNKNIKIVSCKNLFFSFAVVIALLSGIKLSINLINDDHLNEIKTFKNNLEYVLPYKAKSSLDHRLELNKVAWKNIKENPVTGIGLLNFVYFNYRDTVDYIYGKSLYVHNDYLQIWLEIGTLGLLSFLLIIGTMYWQGIASLKRINKEQQIWVISILAALTTYFTHALVSYVFYAPLLVCLATGYLAVLSNTVRCKNHGDLSNKSYFSVMQILKKKAWVFKILISLFIATFIFGHAAAQISARAGVSLLKDDKINQASELFTLARKFSPNVVDYYLIEANVWKKIALTNNDSLAANRADSLYAKTMLQNPYDMESRLYRAMLHRDGASLLNAPVSSATLLGWLEYALAWRPHHHKIQAEYLRTLKKIGRVEEARSILAGYIDRYPESKLLIKVSDELIYLNGLNEEK